ncbi:hypothetical protein [Asticcacaulis sp. 201]|uniref:hypothetical protein n=1 Tax=Asticcacaulis sp. 201 TaxID=3028787 RepID=UPI0029167498|nr:hypothetical protein [Asticcacaulis sp. 201]MDV6329909.1 hypothetical protein [Asticcacaulis sp. 201]
MSTLCPLLKQHEVRMSAIRLETDIATAKSSGRSVDALDILIARVAAGERLALTGIYHLMAGKMMALLLDVTQDRAAAEGVIAAIFVAIWRRAEDFHTFPGTASDWLFSILRDEAVTALGSLDALLPPHPRLRH